jgi:CubicO group peptidase (beta-lactamase class C family)
MRLTRPCLAVLFSSAAIVLQPATLRAQGPPSQELPHPKTLAELQKAMQDVVSRDKLTGAGVALISNGQLLWCGGFGKADLTSNRDVTCDTEFRVGSISKSFVALALLKLQEDGKINLESRLRDVAPEIPVENRWETGNPVRIVNLLEHTAGFDDMEAAEVYNHKDPYDYSLLDVFKRFREPQDVRWPPSTRMSYSNPGYGIAGYLIEKVSGRPYDQYIHDNILAPLGITIGDFRFTDANKALLATGYSDPQHSTGWPYIYLRPAGDMKASPGELAKLVQFFLRRGKTADNTPIVHPESIVRMETVETTLAAKNGLRLGYGLANYSEVVGGVVTHGHDGGIDGFISTYRYMPEQNWGYVVLLNSTQSYKALLDLNSLAIDFLAKDFAKPQRPAASASAADLQKLAGFYTNLAPRSQVVAFLDDFGGVRIAVSNGQLTRSSLFGKPEPLVPLGKNFFRGEKEPEATAVFIPLPDGDMAFSSQGIDGFSYGERTSIFWTWLRIVVVILCLLLMVSSLLFGVLWVLRKLFGGLKDVQHLSVRALPLLATICFIGFFFCCTKFGGLDSGVLNTWTGGIFLLGLLFPLLALFSLLLVLRVPKSEIAAGVRVHSLLVALACCVLAGFLISWHLVGLRLWAAY